MTWRHTPSHRRDAQTDSPAQLCALSQLNNDGASPDAFVFLYGADLHIACCPCWACDAAREGAAEREAA